MKSVTSIYPKTGKRASLKRRFDTKGEATDFANTLTSNEAAPLSVRNMTKFNKWIDSWFMSYRVSAGLSPKTIIAYSGIIDRLKVHFGAARIDLITPSRIEKLYARMLNPTKGTDDEITKAPLTAVTCKRHQAVLHSAFRFAVRDGYLKANPADNVDLPRMNVKEVEPPTAEEIDKAILLISDTGIRSGVILAVYTGMRSGELLELKWNAIDFDDQKIHVRAVRQAIPKSESHTRRVDIPMGRSVVYIERNCTKSKHDRSLTIPESLVEYLKSLKKEQTLNRLRFGESYYVSEYVCIHEDGIPIAPYELSKAIPGHRFHDLRHANAALLIDAGLPIAEVSRRLGHTTVTTTLSTYTHAIKTRDEQAAEVHASTANYIFKI